MKTDPSKIRKQTILQFFLLCSLYTFSQSFRISETSCEHLYNPIGIDVSHPRLSWKIASDRRGFEQSAYQIKVSSEGEEVWNTGKVLSNNSLYLKYEGPKLESRKRYYWQVKVWNRENKVSRWSEKAFWEMGLLSKNDWSARWITSTIEEDTSMAEPPIMYRKTFELKKKVKRARAYVTSRGLYEASLNGEKIGDQLFTPGWTSYNNRLQYQTYDITDQLVQGTNVTGAILGDGWYRGNLLWEHKRNFYGKTLALLMELYIEYEDGSIAVVGTDNSWKTAVGPIRSSDIYNGEVYDARLENQALSTKNLDGPGWKGTIEMSGVKADIVGSMGVPVRVTETIKPVATIKTPKGEIVVDMGQNMVGSIRLKVKGAKGTRITLNHAEVLDKDGNFYTDNLRSAKQEVVYTLKGEGMEIYEPKFTFMGFRYVSIKGWTGDIPEDMITGLVIHSDYKSTGTFETSNPDLNQLQKNIEWGQRGNFLDVPTDCPQRDERLGWTGDAQVFARTAAYNGNVAAFFLKWLKDLALDQRENGAVPWVLPDVINNGRASAGWGDAAVIIPWDLYQIYGDIGFLEEQYKSMKAWIGYIRTVSGSDNLWNEGTHFGDWLFYSLSNDTSGKSAVTDKHLIAQCFYIYSTSLVLKTAKVLKKETDVADLTKLLATIKNAFLQEYLTPNGSLVSNTQTAYVLALHFDILPENLRRQAADRLVQGIKDYDNHITTGFLGTPYINLVLSRFGHHKEAYELLLQDTYPSWLYPVKMGATTIWERWDGIRTDGTFQDVGMNSFNHYAYGAIGDWMYGTIAGINADETSVGYKRSIIRPRPGGGLSYAKASYETVYGQIKVDWELKEGMFDLSVIIPSNTKATVFLPGAKMNTVMEGGKGLSKSKGISDIKEEGTNVSMTVKSGTYHFNYIYAQ